MPKTFNLTEEELFKMEISHRRSLSMSNRDIYDTFPEAKETIERNLRRLYRELNASWRKNNPRYIEAVDRIRHFNGPELAIDLASWWFFELPTAKTKERIFELEKLLRLYQTPTVSSGSLSDADVARAKSRQISEFIQVPRSGFVRCPFHNERTPSCKVNKKGFHCFGCGEHGDVIDWIMKTENKDFKAAVKSLI